MILVRPEVPADHDAVDAIIRGAFGRPEEATLVATLRRVADPQISLVALLEARVVGHVFFSPVTIEGASAPLSALGLAPLAVEPSYQRRGIGSALVRSGLTAAERAGCAVVVVWGHTDYYPRFGFRPAAGFGLRYERSPA